VHCLLSHQTTSPDRPAEEEFAFSILKPIAPEQDQECSNVSNPPQENVRHIPIQKDLESDVARQIVDISLALNNDQTKPEGIGSAGCIMLLLRSVLIQRDIINELSYKVSVMEKQASSKAKDGNVK